MSLFKKDVTLEIPAKFLPLFEETNTETSEISYKATVRVVGKDLELSGDRVSAVVSLKTGKVKDIKAGSVITFNAEGKILSVIPPAAQTKATTGGRSRAGCALDVNRKAMY